MERIYLVGFMGAGKSSVGPAVAARLGWSFLDLDHEIEKAENMSVREIFARFGESRFRLLERQHLERLSGASRVVLALGGGAYVEEATRRIADSTGIPVWLKVSFANVLRRVTMDGTRPMLQDPEQAERLHRQRTAAYALARVHVSTDNREPADIVEEIVGRVREL